MKTIVVYYSRNGENYYQGQIKNLTKGNGQKIVEIIAKNKDVTVFQVEPVREYPKSYTACTQIAKEELEKQIKPKITNYVHRFEDYEQVILVYPNWWSTMPMVMWTSLQSHDTKGKHIYPICTHEGSGMGNSIADIKTLCSQAIVHDGLAIRGSEVAFAQGKIKNYLGEIK